MSVFRYRSDIDTLAFQETIYTDFKISQVMYVTAFFRAIIL